MGCGGSRNTLRGAGVGQGASQQPCPCSGSFIMELAALLGGPDARGRLPVRLGAGARGAGPCRATLEQRAGQRGHQHRHHADHQRPGPPEVQHAHHRGAVVARGVRAGRFPRRERAARAMPGTSGTATSATSGGSSSTTTPGRSIKRKGRVTRAGCSPEPRSCSSGMAARPTTRSTSSPCTTASRCTTCSRTT